MHAQHVPENQKQNGGQTMETHIWPRQSPTEKGKVELYWFSKHGEEGHFSLTPRMARVMAEELLRLSREAERQLKGNEV